MIREITKADTCKIDKITDMLATSSMEESLISKTLMELLEKTSVREMVTEEVAGEILTMRVIRLRSKILKELLPQLKLLTLLLKRSTEKKRKLKSQLRRRLTTRPSLN